MDEINEYLDKVFSVFPVNEKTLTAKAELGQMMEDKYDDLISEGKTHTEAIKETIDEFGDPDELKSMFEEAAGENDGDSETERASAPVAPIPVGTHGFPAFSRISIATAADIKIKTGERYDVICDGFKYSPEVSVENGTLTIHGGKGDHKSALGFSFLFIKVNVFEVNKSGEITVTVPVGTRLSDISLSTGNCDIKISHINAENVSLKTLAGDIKLRKSQIDNLNISVTAGDISFKNFESSRTNINAVSGDVKGEIIVADTFKMSTVSGDSLLSFANYKRLDISATSGDIKLSTTQNIWQSDIQVSTISGDINVGGRKMLREYIQDGTDGSSISLRTVSGDCTLDYEESE